MFKLIKFVNNVSVFKKVGFRYKFYELILRENCVKKTYFRRI